jgi:hypothetical protein
VGPASPSRKVVHVRPICQAVHSSGLLRLSLGLRAAKSSASAAAASYDDLLVSI